MTEFERRVQTLEDLAAIKRLKADYCTYGDIWKYDAGRGDKFGALFAADGTWDVGHKLCKGPAEISAELMSLPEGWKIRVGLHFAINPRIDIDGDTASGTWHFLIPVVPEGQSEPGWNFGIYYEKYVRTPEGWRFKEVRGETAFAPGSGND